jgi:hypothetical protein
LLQVLKQPSAVEPLLTYFGVSCRPQCGAGAEVWRATGEKAVLLPLLLLPFSAAFLLLSAACQDSFCTRHLQCVVLLQLHIALCIDCSSAAKPYLQPQGVLPVHASSCLLFQKSQPNHAALANSAEVL